MSDLLHDTEPTWSSQLVIAAYQSTCVYCSSVIALTQLMAVLHHDFLTYELTQSAGLLEKYKTTAHVKS